MNLSRREAVVVIILLSLGVSIFLYPLTQAVPKPSPNLGLDDFPSTVSYVVKTDGLGVYWMTDSTGHETFWSDNQTLVEQYALGNLTSGTLYLMQVQHNSSLTVPANVMVIQDYQGEISYYSVVRVGVLNATSSYIQPYNLLIENGSSFPATVSSGYLFFRTDYNMLTFYNGTGWTNCTTVADDDSMYLLTSSSTNFLLQNGTRALTANWNAGTYGIYGLTWLNSTSVSTDYVYLGSLTSDPVSPTVGQMWYRSDTEQFKAYNGTVIILSSGGATGPAGPAGTANGLPYNYLIFNNVTATYMVNGTSGNVDYQSTNASKTIGFALGNLTSGRTTKETVFLQGTFQVDYKISIPSYTKLIIDGCLNNTNTSTNAYILSAANVNNIEILGGEINGNDLTDDGSEGIDINTVSDCLIDGVYVHNISYTNPAASNSYGIYVIDSQRVTIQNCKIEYCDHGGVMISQSSYCTIQNCIGNRNAEGADPTMLAANFIIFGASGTWSIGNKILNCYSNGSLNHGIQIYNYANHTTISGCTSTNAVSTLIVVGNQPCYHTIISNNHVFGKGGESTSGIELSDYAYDTIVEGNEVGDVPYGIYVGELSNYSQIVDNRLYGNISKGGIYVFSSNNVISGNAISMETNINYVPAIQLDDLKAAIVNNTVSFNRITSRTAGTANYGIIMEDVSYNTIAYNIIDVTSGGSHIAFNVDGSGVGNIIEHNEFSGTVQIAGAQTVRWNRGYKTEGSASVINGSLYSFNFTIANVSAVTRVLYSFNSTIVSPYWNCTGTTLKVWTDTVIAVNNTACYVEWYCWDDP